MEEQHITQKRRKIHEINNNNNSESSLTRRIKMFCPAASKVAEIMAWEDQRLDLGKIARVFGLEPETLKLNGHFISRGVDLIASSVTWRSLLSFFCSKGLSTGTDSSDALVVDGKLFNSGIKRGRDSGPVVENGVNCVNLQEEGGGTGRINKKLKENQMDKFGDSIALKRKICLENVSPLIKRNRVNGSYSDEFSIGHEESEYSISKLRCGYQLRDTVKRTREDEVVASSCKRAR
ncbi:hypothetical protein SOVF_045670 [Spinacia oleracea]|uniref:Aminotransferase-like plant mobile domain-containing protein n=1 Tax=Spinacia oleracea TaxID=3562 RepID=A0A9R0JBN0_SPIOL|nr:uncharacterized protein LOC110803592 [Spinacia oleracea]KNA21179.1 hypothetical protein SOVF_045670 [Spinacia oleracea]